MIAERWQQWMPFHIDRWKGSPHVQAMRAAARAGFLYLLTSMWQTADCTLPTDHYDLATLAGLNADEWAEYGPIILRRFEVINARLRNNVLFAEWSEAKRIFESRQNAAKRTNTVRTPHGDRTVTVTPTERGPLRSADTITGTGTETTTGTKANTLAVTALAVPASPVAITLPLTAGKKHLITQADVASYAIAYPGVDIMAELRKVPPWLDANPNKRSANVQGSKQRVVKWLTKAQNESGGRGQASVATQPKIQYSDPGAMDAR